MGPSCGMFITAAMGACKKKISMLSQHNGLDINWLNWNFQRGMGVIGQIPSLLITSGVVIIFYSILSKFSISTFSKMTGFFQIFFKKKWIATSAEQHGSLFYQVKQMNDCPKLSNLRLNIASE